MGTSRYVGLLAAALMLATPLAAHANTRIDRFRIDPHGRVSGLILGDGTEYVVPTTVGTQLTQSFHPGDSIHIDPGPNNTLIFQNERTGASLDLGHVDTLARGGGPV